MIQRRFSLRYIIAILLCLFSYNFAQLPSDIELESDRVEYSKNNQKVEAKGNVQLHYQAYSISSNRFIFDTEDAYVEFPDPLRLYTNTQDIHMDTLSYNFETQLGRASKLHSQIQTLLVEGDHMTFSPEKIVINNAYFTSCDAPDPHFHIRSEHIDVYYPLGFFVARKSHFHFDYLPFDIPVPYYIYGSTKYTLFGAASLLPQFGNSPLEGQYAKYKASYVLSNSVSGTADLAYSEKLKWMIGGSNIYHITPHLHTGIRYHYYPEDDIRSVYFISKLKVPLGALSENVNSFDLLVQKFDSSNHLPTIEADFILQQRRIENDYWVDHLPKLQMHLTRYTLNNSLLSWGGKTKTDEKSKFSAFKTISVDSTLGFSQSKEKLFDARDYSFSSSHLYFRNIMQTTVFSSPLSTLTFALNTDLHRYESNRYWSRMFHISTISFKTLLSPEFRYLKRVINNGNSPFEYEKNFTYLDDEVGLGISQGMGPFRFGSDLYYTLDTETLRELDLSVALKFHCWQLEFAWRTQQERFNFNFSLL